MTDDITPISPGEPAPDFTLPNLLNGNGNKVALSALRGSVVVLNFWSGECAWSRHYDAYFAEQAQRWAAQGVHLLHIASNDNETPDFARQKAAEFGMRAPLLHDPGSAVADAYGAVTTPHVFVLDPGGCVAYQGAVDDRTFRQREATVNYLSAAVDAVREGHSPEPASVPPYGCTIVRPFETA